MRTLFGAQPIAYWFGHSLTGLVSSARWDRAEMAVAWARRSGTRHLMPTLKHLLASGGVLRVTVGVDLGSTSTEALGDLLQLGSEGDAETYVHHNEAGGSFHPKVYLLESENRASLIVGSNNLTEGGLFNNCEANLLVDTVPTDPVIVEARNALVTWRDTSTGIAKRLDEALLADLQRLGYVAGEDTLRERRRQDTSGPERASREREGLFGRLRFASPPAEATAVGATLADALLLMRVRRASEHARRTQVQIPFEVFDTGFFAGVPGLTSGHDGRLHSFIEASARGGRNTMKVELPEIGDFAEPVVRLERTESSITYLAFDGTSVYGAAIMRSLREGLDTDPRLTQATRPRDLERATWWRFV